MGLKLIPIQDLIDSYNLPRTLEKMGNDSFHFRDEEVENPGRGDGQVY